MQRVPWLTHLVAGLVFGVWSVLTEQRTYGIDTSGAAWLPDSWSWVRVTLVATLTAGLAVAVGEVLLLRLRTAWPARVLGVLWGVVAGLFAGLPTGLRFFGDTSPAYLSDVTASMAGLGVVVLGQLLLTLALARSFPRAG